jgi:hypothetical protein
MDNAHISFTNCGQFAALQSEEFCFAVRLIHSFGNYRYRVSCTFLPITIVDTVQGRRVTRNFRSGVPLQPSSAAGDGALDCCSLNAPRLWRDGSNMQDSHLMYTSATSTPTKFQQLSASQPLDGAII